MTEDRYAFTFSRHDLPEVLQEDLAHWKSEGAGKTGCSPHPRSRAQWWIV